MSPRELRTIAAAALSLLFALAPLASIAQSDSAGYPSRTIKLVVGFAAGGGNDIFARIVGQALQENLGQSVIVENKVGAGGRLAAEYVAAQPPDGYTLLVGASGAMAISPAVIEKINYDTLRDFVPISLMAEFPLLMVVNSDHPAKTVKELVAWAKANPDKANYGTSSPAFTLATELFKLKSGAPFVAIPYKSGNEMVISVMNGQSAVTIVDPPPATPQIQAGKLRGLAVTAATRLADLPDVPTIDEAGFPDVHVSLWSGIFAPARTPPAIAAKLEDKIRRIVQQPDVNQKFRALATNAVGSTSQEFVHTIETETKMWRDVAAAAHLKFE